jgi:hypothetical protein
MLNGETPLALEPCGAASRSARARAPAGTPSRRRASRQPVAGPGRAGGKLGARPRAPPPTCGATRRPAVVSLICASSASSLVYRVRLRLHYTVQRTEDAAPTEVRIAANASRREHEPRGHTRGTIFSHLCTQGVHRRLSTFEYARPRSAWISHDYIPPPAANTLQSR